MLEIPLLSTCVYTLFSFYVIHRLIVLRRVLEQTKQAVRTISWTYLILEQASAETMAHSAGLQPFRNNHWPRPSNAQSDGLL